MEGHYLRRKGDPVLRQKCAEVSDFSNLDSLITQMENFFTEERAGLAACQIGVLKRVMLAKINGQIREFINPTITESKGYIFSIESCVSMSLWETVFRFRKDEITVEYQDKKGNTYTESYVGNSSKVIQHEIDHLNGILMTDYFFGSKYI